MTMPFIGPMMKTFAIAEWIMDILIHIRRPNTSKCNLRAKPKLDLSTTSEGSVLAK
jgi:hypothetical protein